MVATACGLTAVGTAEPVSDGGSGGGGGVGAEGGGAGGDAAPTDGSNSDGGGVTDARPDADSGGGMCPAVCSSCVAGTCFITGIGKACPPGLACDITCTSTTCQTTTFDCTMATSCVMHCNGGGVCDDSIVQCGAGACKVVCGGGTGCDHIQVQAASASSFCFQCNGNPGCDHFKCTPPGVGCKKACTTNCGDLAMCNTCASVASCP